MHFHSRQLGQIEIDENTILTFAQGIPPLRNCTRFQLFHDADQQSPSVFWMQSLDQDDITFSLTTPEQLGIHYEIQLSDAEVAELGLGSAEDAAILLMVYRQDEADDSHPALGALKANIRNPLIVNLNTRQGLQKTGLKCDVLLHNTP